MIEKLLIKLIQLLIDYNKYEHVTWILYTFFFMYYITMCKLTIYSVPITFLVPIREMSFKWQICILYPNQTIVY